MYVNSLFKLNTSLSTITHFNRITLLCGKTKIRAELPFLLQGVSSVRVTEEPFFSWKFDSVALESVIHFLSTFPVGKRVSEMWFWCYLLSVRSMPCTFGKFSCLPDRLSSAWKEFHQSRGFGIGYLVSPKKKNASINLSRRKKCSSEQYIHVQKHCICKPFFLADFIQNQYKHMGSTRLLWKR